jgi:hypothetical protein
MPFGKGNIAGNSIDPVFYTGVAGKISSIAINADHNANYLPWCCLTLHEFGSVLYESK